MVYWLITATLCIPLFAISTTERQQACGSTSLPMSHTHTHAYTTVPSGFIDNSNKIVCVLVPLLGGWHWKLLTSLNNNNIKYRLVNNIFSRLIKCVIFWLFLFTNDIIRLWTNQFTKLLFITVCFSYLIGHSFWQRHTIKIDMKF